MEEQHQGRRYSQITETSSNSAKYASHSSQDDLLSDVSAERYRHGQLGLSAPSRSLGSGSGSDSHYYSDPAAAFPGATNMSGSQFPYGSGYESSGGTRQQTAGFGSYNTSMMMYSVPQANTQTSIYNTSSYAPSLASRNNPMASSSLLSATQDLGQPYFGADVGAVSTSTSLDQHPSHAQTNAYYQDISSSFHYTGNEGVGNASPGTGTSGLTGVESFYQLADLGANSAAMPESAGPDKAAELQEKWQDYQRRLTNVFQDITEGSLERAADGLLSVSFWLLSRVEELGLTEDDDTLHKDRLKLWQDFNNAWIALIFKQKQYMQQAMPGISLQQPLSLRTVKRMGDELIRLCDGIERHGLVDYQLGVWEDEIETLLEDCLTLYENNEDARNDDNNSR